MYAIRSYYAQSEIERGEALLTLMRQGWGQENPAFRQLFTSLFIPEGTAEQIQWFNDLQRMTASPENAARIRRAFGEIDVRTLLPRVQAPTLVLHARHDAIAPVEHRITSYNVCYTKLLRAIAPPSREKNSVLHRTRRIDLGQVDNGCR